MGTGTLDVSDLSAEALDALLMENPDSFDELFAPDHDSVMDDAMDSFTADWECSHDELNECGRSCCKNRDGCAWSGDACVAARRGDTLCAEYKTKKKCNKAFKTANVSCKWKRGENGKKSCVYRDADKGRSSRFERARDFGSRFAMARDFGSRKEMSRD